MNFLNIILINLRWIVCNFFCWRMIRFYKRLGGFDFKIVFDWWLNNMVFFNIVKLVFIGMIIFLVGKVFIMVFCMIGDFENLLIIRRVDILEKLFFVISCCRCFISMLIGW